MKNTTLPKALSEHLATELAPVTADLKLPSPLSTLQIGLGTSGAIAGGAERVFAELASHLPDYGVTFCGAVVFSPPEQDATEKFRYTFAPSGSGLGTRLLNARRLLHQLIRDESFDLVASHFALYSLAAIDAIRRRPFVVHFHGPWSAESIEEGSGWVAAFAKHHFERAVYREADRVIVLSQAFAELVNREYGVPKELVRVVPGSVDIQRFAIPQSRLEARAALGWPTDRPILLSVRRLTKRVGLDLLISAMPGVVARYPDVLLCIGGKGHMRERLLQQVAELKLERHVRFLGFVTEQDLPLAYRAADVNVVPTRACEGFGLVAAEALAAGTPSLVTPVGGLPEIMKGLAPDLVFPSADIKDIESGLLQALSGTIVLPDSQACRLFASEHFSSELMARRTAAVYREAVLAE